ncbi:MAG TPA: hypothetical protein VE174_11720 [Actinomycetota bacterium]|nr:hypothetical protein [Actinomycetota bacterium]
MAQPLAAPSRRSRRIYLWVAAIFLALAVPSGLLLKTGITSLTEGLERFTAPGSATVTLGVPGTYTVFHEYRSSLGGRLYDGPATLPTMNFAVEGPAGTSPAIESSSGNFNYSIGSRAGYAVGSLRIERPGEYRITSVYVDAGDQVVLGLGRDTEKSTLQTVGGFIGLWAAAGLSFFVWFLIFIVRYSKSKREASPADSQGVS